MRFKQISGMTLASMLMATTALAAEKAGADAGSVRFSIPQQPLGGALNSFSRQAGLQIIFPAEAVAGRASPAISGAMSQGEALHRLIAGSGLQVVANDGRTVSLALTDMSSAASEQSSESAASADLAPGDDIVVTGYRLQNRRAIASKRATPGVSEFVTQDEAGQNPDYNIADALRRVPGVFAVFDEDEGRYAAVRGLNPDYSLVTFNGLQLASSDQNSRRVMLEQIPASAVSQMKVVKSLTPDLDGNAIGGLLDLQTRSAFDAPGTYLVAQALAGYYDSRDVPGDNALSVRGDATFSTRFGADDMFGIVLSGSYMERTRDQERLLISNYLYFTPQGAPISNPIGQNAVGLPNNANFLNYTLKSKRFGGSATLEFKPDDRLHAALYYGHYIQDDDETRYGFVATPTGNIEPADASSGLVPRARATASVSQFLIEKPVDIYQARLSHETESGRLDVRASYSQARWDERGPGVSFTTPTTTDLGYRYDNNGVPRLSFVNPGFATSPANYTPTSISSTDFNVRERAKDGQIDYRRKLGDSGWHFGIGGKLKQIERILDRSQPSWSTAGLTLADFLRPGDPYSPPYSTIAVPIPNRVAFWDFFAANPNRFTANDAAVALASQASDYRFEESVAAGYALAEHRGDRHHLIFGGRYEKTDLDVRRFVVQDGKATPIREKNDYDNFLPSAVLSYDVTDMLKLRAAYAKSIGRPNQSDLAGGETRNDLAGTITVSRPNPELKPRRADNFDLSLEYYFDGNDGIISAGVFHKNIKDEIFRGTQLSVIDGVNWQITQPQNLESAKLTGIELNLVKNSFDFLPGFLANFGASINYTYIHTDAAVVMNNGTRRKIDQLLEQPSRLFNASLFYKYDGFEGRLSYSRPGRSYQSISTASEVDDVMYKPFDQLDLQFRYKISEQVQLIAEARNLLGESRDTVRPYFGEVREINQHGRGFWAGLSFRL